MNINKLKLFTLFTLALISSTLSFAGTAEDSALTEKAKTKLLLEEDVPKDIEITTKNNEIFLKGKFNTASQVYRAIEIAASLEGVTDVEYTALLMEGNVNVDSLISAKVKGKIAQLSNDSKIASGHSLIVETDNKEVHIYGTANKDSDIDTIKNTIEKLKGVNKVKIDIKSKK